MSGSMRASRPQQHREKQQRPQHAAFALSLLLHGAAIASGIAVSVGYFGRHPVTLPEEQAVIEIEVLFPIPEILPPEEEMEKPEEQEPLPDKGPETPVIQNTAIPVPLLKEPEKSAAPTPRPAPPPAPTSSRSKTKQAARQAAGTIPLESYARKLARHVAQYKYYPHSARRSRLQGKIIVAFTLNAHGFLYDSRIVQSSGHPLLDDAALETLRRAQPFPPPPEGFTRPQLSFQIPLRYTIKTR